MELAPSVPGLGPCKGRPLSESGPCTLCLITFCHIAELSKYRQFIKCPTREENTLDKCYCNINNAYHVVPRADLRLANELNEFYCRFDCQSASPECISSPPQLSAVNTINTSTPQLSPQAPSLCTPLLPFTPLSIQEWEVNRLFKAQNPPQGSRPRRCLTCNPETLCRPVVSSVYRDLQHISGNLQGACLLQSLHHHPGPQEAKDHRSSGLQTRGRPIWVFYGRCRCRFFTESGQPMADI